MYFGKLVVVNHSLYSGEWCSRCGTIAIVE